MHRKTEIRIIIKIQIQKIQIQILFTSHCTYVCADIGQIRRSDSRVFGAGTN